MKPFPKSVIVIPARLASTRLPNKLLLNKTGKPLIQYTWESACRSQLASDVIIGCDDQKIFDAAVGFGAKVQMTDPNASCGTDRVAEVAENLDAEIIVNVQGDEPFIDKDAIDTLIRLLAEDPTASMATLATPIRDLGVLNNPSCVKVVCDKYKRALYFSRSVIPYPREGVEKFWNNDPPLFYMHLGIYAYRRDFLLQYRTLPRPQIEEAEMLEQLRVLFEGYKILVGTVNHRSVGVNTEEEYEQFVEMVQSGQIP